jgi:hypothetical protein
MSAYSCDRTRSVFDLYGCLMLFIPVATVIAVFVISRDPVSATHSFADNIYDNPCDNIFVDNTWCTEFLIRGSLSPESQVNH